MIRTIPILHETALEENCNRKHRGILNVTSILLGILVIVTSTLLGVAEYHLIKSMDSIDRLKIALDEKTKDRYYGKEARRDQEAIHRHLDRVEKACK